MHTFTYGVIRKIFNVATYGVLGMEVIGEENIPVILYPQKAAVPGRLQSCQQFRSAPAGDGHAPPSDPFHG